MQRDQTAGASQIVTELYESWYSAMVRFAARSVRNVEVAEEIVQEAFMALYKELVAGRSIRQPRAWVMRVVRRSVWRQFAAHPDDQLEHESLDVVDTLPVGRRDMGDDVGELALLLSNLTRREEEAVLLRAAGLDYNGIAQELGLARGTVGTLLSRALRKMQSAAGTPPGGLTRGAHDKASDAPTLQ